MKGFNFSYFSRIFVERELKSSKPRRAASYDDLPPGILKDTSYALSSRIENWIENCKARKITSCNGANKKRLLIFLISIRYELACKYRIS